ncbi:MAG: chemotaxis protein CheX [Pyrinomonadaceae bacterium]
METITLETTKETEKEAKAFPEVILEQTEKSVLETFGKIFGSTERRPAREIECRSWIKIAALISFVGDINWSFGLVLPKESIEAMAQTFAGIEVDFESEEIADIAGELANIVAGAISGNMESVGYNVQLSFPTIFRGEDYEQLIPHHFISERQHYRANGYYFWLKMTVMDNF